MKKFKNFKNFIEVGETETEQTEQIKQWLKENLLYVVLGITLGSGGLFGWNYYQDYQQQYAKDARALYLIIEKEKNKKELVQAFMKLKNNYADSIYLAKARLLLAKNLAKVAKFDEAIAELEPLRANENNIIVYMAQLHLAEIFIETKQFAKAILLLTEQTKRLDTIKLDSYFQALKHNLLGDIYLLQKKNALAKEQFNLARQQPGVNNSELGKILKIKLENL